MFRTEPGGARALIEDWINRPTLRELVEAFGGTWPTGTLEEQVAALAEFSEVWDYRSGKSRLMFHDDDGADDPHAELTYRAAAELGLMNPVPPSDTEYDYLLILGGLATGVEPRVKYAAKLINDGLKIKKQIAGLGSYRPLHERELEISRRYAPEGKYEIDHLAEMMSSYLAPTKLQLTAHETRVPSVLELGLPGPSLYGVAAYAAANQRPHDRPANTIETYELFASHCVLEPGLSLLLVTSPIYLPYQHLDAVQVLGNRNATIETVGTPSNAPSRHPPTAYRQEIRSMIRSMNTA